MSWRSQSQRNMALVHSKPKKAPVPDALTPAYYKAFFEILSLNLTSVLNSIIDGKNMPKDSLLAYITLIAKEGKDLSRCENYRPIALQNTELKLYAKILANWLLPHAPRLIHRD